jgi:general secretion pathway protein M
MQLLPDQKNSRMTATLVLIVVVIMVYMLMFHWFIIRHGEYSSDLGDLREQLARFESVAAMRESAEETLASIRDSRSDASLFLNQQDFNEAAAAMSERLGQMVRTQAEEDCQIVSRQPVRSRVEERYEKVTVNVRMRCQPADLLQIMYKLETEVPMMIVDELNITRPRARRRSGGQIVEVAESLDIRFNMSGYLYQ